MKLNRLCNGTTRGYVSGSSFSLYHIHTPVFCFVPIHCLFYGVCRCLYFCGIYSLLYHCFTCVVRVYAWVMWANFFYYILLIVPMVFYASLLLSNVRKNPGHRINSFARSLPLAILVVVSHLAFLSQIPLSSVQIPSSKNIYACLQFKSTWHDVAKTNNVPLEFEKAPSLP